MRSLVVVRRGHAAVGDSHCDGLSCRYTGFSGCDSQALTCGFSSCGAWTFVAPCGIFPDQALDPMSSALVGGFLSLSPPGSPNLIFGSAGTDLIFFLQESLIFFRSHSLVF